MSKVVDRPLPTPCRVSDIAEFLRVEPTFVRMLLKQMFPNEPLPVSTDRVEPVLAQSLAAVVMTGKVNQHDVALTTGRSHE